MAEQSLSRGVRGPSAAELSRACRATDQREPTTPRDRCGCRPSAVAALRDCPLRWFLDRRVGAGNPSGGAAVVGLVVHAVAEAIARGDVAPDEREIGPFVDEIWASVPFPAHYQRVHERRRVDEMITALLAWDASTGRSVAATELTFNVPVPGASRPVSVSGSIDRVDRSEDGRIHVVDFKTGRTAASAAATAEHPQLGIYQLAIRLGALDGGRGRPSARPTGRGRARAGRCSRPAREASDPVAAPTRPCAPVVLGQAELVHLADRFASGMPKVRFQAPIDDGWTWVNDLIVDAARLADGPEYPARPNGHCKSCAFRFMCPAQSPAAAGQPAVAATPATAEPPGERAERAGHADPTADQPRPADPSPSTGPARARPRRRSSSRSGGMTSDEPPTHPGRPRRRCPAPSSTPSSGSPSPTSSGSASAPRWSRS